MINKRTEPTATQYRGYTIVHNDLGADIWYGSDHLSTERDEAAAKLVIDSYVEADDGR